MLRLYLSLQMTIDYVAKNPRFPFAFETFHNNL